MYVETACNVPWAEQAFVRPAVEELLLRSWRPGAAHSRDLGIPETDTPRWMKTARPAPRRAQAGRHIGLADSYFAVNVMGICTQTGTMASRFFAGVNRIVRATARAASSSSLYPLEVCSFVCAVVPVSST
jgi:hypothetical protein